MSSEGHGQTFPRVSDRLMKLVRAKEEQNVYYYCDELVKEEKSALGLEGEKFDPENTMEDASSSSLSEAKRSRLVDNSRNNPTQAGRSNSLTKISGLIDELSEKQLKNKAMLVDTIEEYTRSKEDISSLKTALDAAARSQKKLDSFSSDVAGQLAAISTRLDSIDEKYEDVVSQMRTLQKVVQKNTRMSSFELKNLEHDLVTVKSDLRGTRFESKKIVDTILKSLHHDTKEHQKANGSIKKPTPANLVEDVNKSYMRHDASGALGYSIDVDQIDIPEATICTLKRSKPHIDDQERYWH